MTTGLAPLKRDVAAVIKIHTGDEVGAVDFPGELEDGTKVTFYAVVTDDCGDEWIGLGWTPRSAWSDAADRVKGGKPLYNLNLPVNYAALI